MKTFDVQSVEIDAPPDVVFDYLARPETLPEWTRAFLEVRGGRATMATPNGRVEVELTIEAARAQRTVDWFMRFPDGSRGRAHSRVVPGAQGRSIYSFVLMAPPVPLERLEGALDAQSRTLARELEELRARLAGRNL